MLRLDCKSFGLARGWLVPEKLEVGNVIDVINITNPVSTYGVDESALIRSAHHMVLHVRHSVASNQTGMPTVNRRIL